jgi:hypothetical protein
MSTERNAVQAPYKPRGATVNIFPELEPDSVLPTVDEFVETIGVVSAFNCDVLQAPWRSSVEIFAYSPKGRNRTSYGLAHVFCGRVNLIATSDYYADLAKWSHHNWHVTANRVVEGFDLYSPSSVPAGWDMIDTSTDQSIIDTLDANECFPAGTVGPMVDDNDDIIELLNAIAF